MKNTRRSSSVSPAYCALLEYLEMHLQTAWTSALNPFTVCANLALLLAANERILGTHTFRLISFTNGAQTESFKVQ